MNADLQYLLGMGVFFASSLALVGFVTYLVRQDARSGSRERKP